MAFPTKILGILDRLGPHIALFSCLGFCHTDPSLRFELISMAPGNCQRLNFFCRHKIYNDLKCTGERSVRRGHFGLVEVALLSMAYFTAVLIPQFYQQRRHLFRMKMLSFYSFSLTHLPLDVRLGYNCTANFSLFSPIKHNIQQIVVGEKIKKCWNTKRLLPFHLLLLGMPHMAFVSFLFSPFARCRALGAPACRGAAAVGAACTTGAPPALHTGEVTPGNRPPKIPQISYLNGV